MKSKRILHIALLALMILPLQAFSQVGIGYKRIALGPRQAGMAAAYTGGLDDAYSLYYNPAALAHGRRWQLAGSYTKWFADTQYSSLIGVKQYQFLGSKKSTIAFGINYMGMPEWDSTNGLYAPVSASSYAFTISAAQRLDWLKWPSRDFGKHFALGVNSELMYNDWAGYTAFGATLTAGISYKSNRKRVNWGPLEYLQYGIGLSYKNINLIQPEFDVEKTEIPQNLAIGTSISAGRHRGFALQLNVDYGQYKDEDGFILVGSELWWRNIIGLRAGYEFARETGSGFSMGTSLRLPVSREFDTRIDFAQSNFGEILNQTYRGGIAAFPSGPEPFGMIFPADRVQVPSQVTLSWEESEDPDPFDIVNYYLIVDPDINKVQNTLDICKLSYNDFYNEIYLPRLQLYSELENKSGDIETVPEVLINNVQNPQVRSLLDTLLVCYKTTSLTVKKIDLGLDPHKDYYWSVIAADLDGHIRVAHGSNEIRQFQTILPSLTIKNIQVEPTNDSTTEPRGNIKVIVANESNIDMPQQTLDFNSEAMNSGKLSSGSEREEYAAIVNIPPLGPGQSGAFLIEDVPLDMDMLKTYYWTAAAVQFQKTRKAETSSEIREFSIIRPYLTLEDIYLEPINEITTVANGLQGDVKIVISNEGVIETPKYSIDVYAQNVTPGFHKSSLLNQDKEKLFATVIIPPIDPGQKDTLVVKENWTTEIVGEHKFYANALAVGVAADPEMAEKSKILSSIYTVPKWNGDKIQLAIADSFKVRTNRFEHVEVPVLPWVFFDANSIQISENVVSDVAPLSIIAKRLVENPNIKISLQGYLDTTRVALGGKALYGQSDDNNPQLAVKRVQSVKSYLIRRGVNADQIEIVTLGYDPFSQRLTSGNIQNIISHEYINNENRRVRIQVASDVDDKCEAEWALFRPNPVPIKRSFDEGVLPEFNVEIVGGANFADWQIVMVDPQTDKEITSVSAESLVFPDDSLNSFAISSSRAHTICWKNALFDASTDGLTKVDCYIEVQDKVGDNVRSFKSRNESFIIYETEQTLMDRIFTMYVFDETEPVTPCVYGERMIEPLLHEIQEKIEAGNKIKIVFEGHTDIIGTIGRNMQLANQRAEGLKSEFETFVQSQDTEELAEAIRTALVMGYAYLRPLTIELDGNKSLVIGDNANPLGRNFNRRSEIKVIKIND